MSSKFMDITDGTNINTLTNYGMFCVNNGVNAPITGYCNYLVIPTANNALYTTQFAMTLNENSIYTRTQINGAWSEWAKYVKNSNFTEVYTASEGVCYIKIGRLVAVSINKTISGDTPLGIPDSFIPNSIVLNLRDNDTGELATFWIDSGAIQTFKAINYTSGHTYRGNLVYLSLN